MVILLFFMAFTVVSLYAMRTVKRTGRVPLRRLPGLDAIDEAIGRVTEMGQPAAFVFGTGVLEGQQLAAFELLRYTAEQTAKYDARLIVCNPLPELQPIAEEIVQSSYRTAGKADNYRPEDVRYIASAALRAAVLGIFQRERVAANFMFGNYYHEAIIFAEAGNAVGAIQIAGTANLHQLPFFVASCDYTLIGEEIFAAGAYLSGNSTQLGFLIGQEVGKATAVVLIVLGTILACANQSFLANLLKK
ncbi:MAG: hypothetical protein Q8P50_08375 [Bacillota bacterium]|nr:hypothetical protein [Bacillota bacterium]